MLRAKLAYKLDGWVESIFLLFPSKGINPNVLTFSGLILSIGACLSLAFGELRLGGGLVLLAGTFDVLDGAAARIYKRDTSFGVLLDSVADRYSDLVVYVGLIVYCAQQGRMADLVVATVALVGCSVVPYVRARGETLIPECKIGLMERAERIIVLSLGLLLGLLTPTLWLLAILSHVTVLQRLHYVRRQLNDRCQEGLPKEVEELPVGRNVK